MKHSLKKYTTRDLKIAFDSPNFSIEETVAIEVEYLRRLDLANAATHEAVEMVRIHNLP